MFLRQFVKICKNSRIKSNFIGKSLLSSSATPRFVADSLRLPHNYVLNKIQGFGIENIKLNDPLNEDDLQLLLLELNVKAFDFKAIPMLSKRPPHLFPETLPQRAPVVTIMGNEDRSLSKYCVGHVDHGKTTLLDYLRKSNVAAQETGGITQHIGAFSVQLPGGQSVTFLDTPGHAAFTSIRARGANVTDIVILVVAAEDGVMEQTLESIKMAKAANVTVIVALNKVDKAGITPEIKLKVKKQLLQAGLALEEFGGDVQTVEVSGLTGHGVDKLVEAILAQAEVADLRAEVDSWAEGAVIESKMVTGVGHTATVLVQRGTLKRGSLIVADESLCKVRSLTDCFGRRLTNAVPSTAIEITGWRSLPAVGSEFIEVSDGSEEFAGKVIEYREKIRLWREDQNAKVDPYIVKTKENELWEEFRKRAAEDPTKRGPFIIEQKENNHTPTLHFVIKCDAVGTVEAIQKMFQELPKKAVHAKILSIGTGAPSEDDLETARAASIVSPSDKRTSASCPSSVSIVCFNENVPKAIEKKAKFLKIPIQKYSIIYRLFDDIKARMMEMVPITYKESVTGIAKLLKVFTLNQGKKNAENVAGCIVEQGIIALTDSNLKFVRIKRNLNGRNKNDFSIVYDNAKIKTLRHLKEEVQSVKIGMECGILFEDKSIELQPGDIVEHVVKIEAERELR